MVIVDNNVLSSLAKIERLALLPEIEIVLNDLREKDGYRFSDDDRQNLFDRLP